MTHTQNQQHNFRSRTGRWENASAWCTPPLCFSPMPLQAQSSLLILKPAVGRSLLFISPSGSGDMLYSISSLSDFSSTALPLPRMLANIFHWSETLFIQLIKLTVHLLCSVSTPILPSSELGLAVLLGRVILVILDNQIGLVIDQYSFH